MWQPGCGPCSVPWTLMKIGSKLRGPGVGNASYREMLDTHPPSSSVQSGRCFSCLLALVFRPCMVLHETTQHGSTCFLYSAKELNNVRFT
jgi:hypothetical protein